MPETYYVSLNSGDGPACGSQCRCRVGNKLSAVFVGVTACPGFSVSGLNGTHNDIDWNGTIWIKTILIDGFPFDLQVSCSPNCETWNVLVPTYFTCVFAGYGCAIDSFGSPVANAFTVCGGISNPSAINGTVTIDIG